MCGICGIVSFDPGGDDTDRVVEMMRDTLTHRGPDDRGLWRDATGRAVFGHTRLEIVDLSDGGAQPMSSHDGRWTVSYNGEIYNHPDLRVALGRDGVSFRSGSDTEVLVEAIATWGIAAALDRVAGMFAFAAFDVRDGVLHLVRDRLGKKPLYVAARGPQVAFASEVRALLRWPALAPRIDPDAAAELLAYGYVRGSRSILDGVFRLPPGTRLAIANAADARVAAAERYWDPQSLLVARDAHPEGAVAERDVEAAIGTAVEQRMLADVPVGALLSGGIDSSLVAALMQERAGAQVKTFSIGFRERDYDEAAHAAAIAQHLGTAHTELYVTAAQALAAAQDIPEVFDEPFADSSQVPTLLVARMTREHVKVALSGDGGDEMFGGYHRHVHAQRLGSVITRVPGPLRRAGAAVLDALPGALVDRVAAVVMPRDRVLQGAGDRVHRLAWLLGSRDVRDLYERALRLPRRGLGLAPPGVASGELPRTTAAECFMYLDTIGYLPDDILVKVDRASMSCGLEVRSPLLDHRVAELAWRLDPAQRAGAGEGKRVLRRLLARRLPEALFMRPKAGFAAPLHAWLRGPLRDWADALLEPGALAADGFVDPGAVRRAWSLHQSGRRNMQYALWPVLMLRAWRVHWGV